MKKSVLIIALIILFPAFVIGQNEFSEFQIFKEDIINEVYENDEYTPLMDMNQAKKDLAQLTRSYDDLVSSVKVLQSRKSSMSKHYNNARVSAHATLQDMVETQEALTKRQTQVTLSLNKVRELEDDIELLSQDIEISKKHIWTYSKFLFKTLNDFYLSSDELSSLKVLTKSESVAHTLGSEDISSLLYQWLEKTFLKMKQLTNQYDQTLHEIQSSIANYHFEIENYQKDLNNLKQQSDHVEQLLSFLEEDKNFLEDQIDNFEKSEKNLQYQIDRMDKITSETTKFLDENKEVANLLSKDDKQNWSDYFSRPIRIPELPKYSLKDALYENTQWLVLPTEQWQEIYAPAPWIVYKVQAVADVWLNRVILLHKYWYTSVILPLSDVFVRTGDVVKRWEIIWRAWGKPWTIGAWLDSSESHLYFEILKNSDSIDPLLVMDLSVFQSIDDLQERYHLKWKQDFIARNIDLSNLPKLQWDSVQERRDYFLSRSWNSIFSDPWLWVNASKWTGIDPMFWICIGAAETSYKNFKSWNNIGNVWNDDSGNTIVYNSPLSWVAAIFKTLSNQYLGGYMTMDQLSRYGNKDSYIYASDPINRQKNIMRCLSMIYEVNVTEEYFYRVLN